MPTFQFFKSQTKVDELTGADGKKLEEKIKNWIVEEEASDCGVKGHVSNTNRYLIDKAKKSLKNWT